MYGLWFAVVGKVVFVAEISSLQEAQDFKPEEVFVSGPRERSLGTLTAGRFPFTDQLISLILFNSSWI
jgi:hypothetical protein